MKFSFEYIKIIIILKFEMLPEFRYFLKNFKIKIGYISNFLFMYRDANMFICDVIVLCLHNCLVFYINIYLQYLFYQIISINELYYKGRLFSFSYFDPPVDNNRNDLSKLSLRSHDFYQYKIGASRYVRFCYLISHIAFIIKR